MNDALKAAQMERAKREKAKRLSFGEANDSQNALSVLEQIEQSGDIRPAEAEMLKRLRSRSGEIQDEIGRTEATYRGALQGGTFQFADEIHGLLGGDKEAAREKNRAAQGAYPDEFKAGKTAGAIGSGIGSAALTGPLGTGRTLISTMLRGAGLGGAEGALWGAGGGEGLLEKSKEAAKYGGIGAGAGLAAPAIVAGGAAAGRGLTNLVGGAVNVGNKGRAYRAINDTLRKSGITGEEAVQTLNNASQMGQGRMRLMDATGLAGQRRASGIVRAGGDGAEEIAQFLRQRQLDQGDRVAGFIDDAFETRGTSAAMMKDQVKTNRKNVADTLFSNAAEDAAPVNVRDAVGQLDATIGQMSNSGIRPTNVVREFQKLRSKLAGQTPDGSPTTLSDYESVLGLWREVRDDVANAFKNGNGALGEALKPIRDSLQAALEESSDLYRFATDNYREGSRVLDAFDEGAKMTRPSRAIDNINKLQGMTDQQRKAARIGYGDEMLKRIEGNASPTSNKAKPFTSSKVMQETDALAKNPRQFADRIAIENDMWETQNRALGGSRTADNLEDIADAGLMADVGRAARDVSSGNFGSAVSNAIAPVSRAITGQNPATRKLIADILMAPNPRAAIAAATAQEATSQGRKRIAEAVLRALGRQPEY